MHDSKCICICILCRIETVVVYCLSFMARTAQIYTPMQLYGLCDDMTEAHLNRSTKQKI